MRRILLLLAALLAAAWWFRRGQRPAEKPKAKRAAQPVIEGPMVRDRVCNTFLPRSRARVVETEGEPLFFCSQACQDTWASTSKAS